MKELEFSACVFYSSWLWGYAVCIWCWLICVTLNRLWKTSTFLNYYCEYCKKYSECFAVNYLDVYHNNISIICVHSCYIYYLVSFMFSDCSLFGEFCHLSQFYGDILVHFVKKTHTANNLTSASPTPYHGAVILMWRLIYKLHERAVNCEANVNQLTALEI
jgi:hypothetical protein